MPVNSGQVMASKYEGKCVPQREETASSFDIYIGAASVHFRSQDAMLMMEHYRGGWNGNWGARTVLYTFVCSANAAPYKS